MGANPPPGQDHVRGEEPEQPPTPRSVNRRARCRRVDPGDEEQDRDCPEDGQHAAKLGIDRPTSKVMAPPGAGVEIHIVSNPRGDHRPLHPGEAGVVTLVLCPRLGDFNEDLRRLGRLAAGLRDQLASEDAHPAPDRGAGRRRRNRRFVAGRGGCRDRARGLPERRPATPRRRPQRLRRPPLRFGRSALLAVPAGAGARHGCAVRPRRRGLQPDGDKP
jgi:hypothetical protein